MLMWFGSPLKAGKPVVAYRTISEYSHPGPWHPPPPQEQGEAGGARVLSQPGFEHVGSQVGHHDCAAAPPPFESALFQPCSLTWLELQWHMYYRQHNTQPDLCLPCFSPALLPGFSYRGICIAGNITLSLIWVCLVLALLSYLALTAMVWISQAL